MVSRILNFQFVIGFSTQFFDFLIKINGYFGIFLYILILKQI